MASTTPRVAEATPDRWQRKFSAFGGQDAARGAGDGGDGVARREAGAVLAFHPYNDRRVDQPECGQREVEARDHPRLSRHQRGVGVGVGGHYGVGGDVAGAA
jgi:hypothetical protein